MNEDTLIYIAGHTGLVGSAILRNLESVGHQQIVTRTRKELDLTHREAVDQFFNEIHPEIVFLAAAHVGGIKANDTYPADFIHNNLVIQTNIIDAAYKAGVSKLIFLGSSCIYPRLAPQPITEDALLTGPLESTNEWYAIAKIAGIKMCQAYRKQYGFNAIALMPTNLYGPGDNFDLETSHVLPALIRRFHEAKQRQQPFVRLWGTGTPRREFLHVDDMADAAVYLMKNYNSGQIVNVGVGEDITISELASLIKRVTDYQGNIEYDSNKPDGTPRKLLDISRLRTTGWQARIPLHEGVESTYHWYLSNIRENLKSSWHHREGEQNFTTKQQLM